MVVTLGRHLARGCAEKQLLVLKVLLVSAYEAKQIVLLAVSCGAPEVKLDDFRRHYFRPTSYLFFFLNTLKQFGWVR